MQSSTQSKSPPSRGLKKINVDNWGSFFLQRLQQLHFEEELLDLTIKFPTNDITIQAHRLVITTCTDYFMRLEQQQKEKDENFDGVLIMPPDIPYECVKSIISFMYTGQLEYLTSEHNALYRTTQQMNMTVLTKLLDAQINASSSQSSPPATTKSSPQPISVSQKLPNPVKEVVNANQLETLPSQPLPGRKSPIRKRKLNSRSTSNCDDRSHPGANRKASETSPGPSRFDLPEVNDFAHGVCSSFDNITCNKDPIVQAPDHVSNLDVGGHLSSIDSEISRRHDTAEDDDENSHKIQRDDSRSKESDDKLENLDYDWAGSKPILGNSEICSTSSKRVRFETEEKENLEKIRNETSTEDAMYTHAKIIREVLKKYPHFVKNYKNIRLEIMQKEHKSSDSSGPANTKFLYVVSKSDLVSNSEAASEKGGKGNVDGGG